MTDNESLATEAAAPKLTQADYQRMKTIEWQQYVASYPPEQLRLQKQAIEIDRLWQKEKDPEKAKALREEHEMVVNKLVELTYPEGYTERYAPAREWLKRSKSCAE